jgi:DNA-binding beta-propeller fold protein YncE
VNVIDLSATKIVGRIDVGKHLQPTGIAASPDRSELYLTFGQVGLRGNQIAVINTRTDTVQGHLRDGISLSRHQGADDIALTPNGSEPFLSGFQVVTPGPCGRVTPRGVVVVNRKQVRPTRRSASEHR